VSGFPVLYSYGQYKCTGALQGVDGETGEKDETVEYDKVEDNEFENCVRVPGELKPVLGYQETLISLSLHRTYILVSLKLR
jgi:hypothetical protein